MPAGRLVAVAVRRATGRGRAAAVAGNLVLAVIGVVLLAPSFQQRTVDEPFPDVAPAAAAGIPPALSPSPSDLTTARAAPTVRAVPPALPKPPVAPPARPGAVPAPAAAPSSAPVPVASGSLDGVGHSASGQAVLYAVDDRLVLRFEDVDIEGTPEPFVHLVPAGSSTPEGSLELGPLTAERGTSPIGSRPMWTRRRRRRC